MILNYLGFLLVGRLFIYLLRLFPPAVTILNRNENTKKLLDCDLCLGVWIYTGLAVLMNMQIVDNANVFGYIVTGSVSSFIMYLIVKGWNQEFTEYVIE